MSEAEARVWDTVARHQSAAVAAKVSMPRMCPELCFCSAGGLSACPPLTAQIAAFGSVTRGHAGQLICGKAAEVGADIAVVGARGLGLVKRCVFDVWVCGVCETPSACVQWMPRSHEIL